MEGAVIKYHLSWLQTITSEYFHWKDIVETSRNENTREKAITELQEISNRFVDYLNKNPELKTLLTAKNQETIEDLERFFNEQ